MVLYHQIYQERRYENMTSDWFGSTNGKDGNLHYYYVDKGAIELATKNVLLIPPVSAVVNANYMPYLRHNIDVMSEEVEYDQERFPLVEGKEYTLISNTLHRITTGGPFRKLADFKPYEISGTDIGGDFKWQNEGKLWNYPFHYLEFNDHLSNPLMIQPQYLKDRKSSSLNVLQNVNNFGMYALYVPGYKGDEHGMIEGVVTANLSMPLSSSAYTDYMARSQEMFKHNRTVSQNGMLFGMGQAVGGLISTNPIGNFMSGAGQVYNNYMNIEGSLATERDLTRSPLTIHSSGGECTFNLNGPLSGMRLYRYGYAEEHLERIGWYFHQFGYKQNRVMKPDLKSRKYFNYIKTNGCNLTGNNIRKDHLSELKQIFERGVRIWHIDNGAEVLNFTKDNVEV